MSSQLLIINIPQGMVNNRTAFNIDNGAFPYLNNSYTWRGRVKRKRGTVPLARLERQLSNLSGSSITVNSGSNTLNLITNLSLETNASIVPGNIVKIKLVINGQELDDIAGNGTFSVPAGNITAATIDYATGVVSFTATLTQAGQTVAFTGDYYPDLPVMGIRDFLDFTHTVSSFSSLSLFPLQLAFDQIYSYQVNQSGSVPTYYSVSYYKGTGNPALWTGTNYELFWSVNYNSSVWVTNGKPGFHFQTINTISVGNPTTITTAANHGLKTGDYVFFSEITGADAGLLNYQSEQITVTTPTAFTVPVNTTGKTINNNGIFQTLTNSSPGALGDGIRWYDGDPTGGTGLYTNGTLGWVNFAPPLTLTSTSINNLPAATYYLVGATYILPFKDRLIFFGPSVQTSTGSPLYLPDTIVYSWNGTPYYATPTPAQETSNYKAYVTDQVGFGGWLSAGTNQEIINVSPNEDVLITAFSRQFARLCYTGDDILPFTFLFINSENIGSTSTFSAINFDRGVISLGDRGITETTQVSCDRIDLVIPDEIFQVSLVNNGVDRVNAIRDYENEWIYFSYPSDNSSYVYPDSTFMYNYRDQTWSILYENYTCRGTFRFLTSDNTPWNALPYANWSEWTDPWNSGATSGQYPLLCAGTPQGFVLIQDAGTGEAPSGYIQSISNDGNGNIQITSPDHCVNIGDYLYFTGAISTFGLNTITGITLGTTTVITANNSLVPNQPIYIYGITGTTQLNGQTYTVLSANSTTITINVNSTSFTPYVSGGTVSSFNFLIGKVITTASSSTFVVDLLFPSGTYQGLGVFTRLSIPTIQTKQFNPFWNEGKQVRLGPQRYLLDSTSSGQLTVNINLSQDPSSIWNSPSNSSVIFSQLVYTCPEGTNLGLTPANINLQMQVANGGGTPSQIWHRYNTSLIGDSVQLTFTLNDSQMRNLTTATSEISLHGINLTLGKGPLLA